MKTVTVSVGEKYEFSDDNTNWEIGTLEAISLRVPLTYQSKNGNRYEWYSFVREVEAHPVFTQAMADNGELPQVGMELSFDGMIVIVVGFTSKGMPVFEMPNGMVDSFNSNNSYKPIDTRTDKEKAIAKAINNLMFFGDQTQTEQKANETLIAIMEGKVSGVKWVGE